MNLKRKILLTAIGVAFAGAAAAQMMHGNTFPFWNVQGPLDVGGATTLRGASTLSGTNVLSGTTTISGTTTLSGATTISGALTTSSTAALKGTTTNDAAAAGNVGELLTTTVAAGSAVAGDTSTTAKNLTSVSLTAGDWDVSGNCNFLGSTLVATVLSCGLGTTTNTQASQAGGSGIGTDPLTIVTGASQTFPDSVVAVAVQPTRVTLASTTTIYLVAKNTFSSGTYTMYGTIRARRMR